MNQKAHGFAYLSLLFVIALLALAGTGLAALEHLDRRQQEEQELLRQGHAFRAALLSFRQAHPSRQLPQTLDQLLEDQRGGTLHRHLRRIPVDPFSRSADWGLIMQGNQIIGVHSLSNGTPLKQAGFDEEDVGFSNATSYAGWTFMVMEQQSVPAQSAEQLGL